MGKRIRSTLESQEKLPVSFLLFVSSLQIFLFSLNVEIATLHFFFKLFLKQVDPEISIVDIVQMMRT